MNRKRYLQILVYFAKTDNDHDDAEKQFIRQVGHRLNLDDNEINEIMEADFNWEPEFPKNEVERYILFDDILDLIAVDNKLTEAEETEARKIANKLGFLPSMVDEIFNNLRRQLNSGIPLNKILPSPDSPTRNSPNYGKYNK